MFRTAPALGRATRRHHKRVTRESTSVPAHRRGFELLESRLLLSSMMETGSIGCGCPMCLAASKALGDQPAVQPVEVMVNQVARVGTSADRVWQPLTSLPSARPGQVSYKELAAYAPFTINFSQLHQTLGQAPMEFTPAARNGGVVLSLPSPTGVMQQFSVQETRVLAPALAAQFPQIKTYVGYGIDDPNAVVRIDTNPHTGFNAMVLSPSGTWAIDNYYHLDTSAYVSYFKNDITTARDFRCLTVSTPNDAPVSPAEGGPENIPAGDVLRTFRLAVTTTTSYNSFHGNTIGSVLSAVTTAVNRITGVYELDLSTRLELVANTTLLFSGLEGNPSISGTGVSTLANNNQAFTDGRIGFGSYDVGHVFHSGSNNGIAGGIGTVGGSIKARGASATSPASGDLFAVDYVSHELGHQFNGRHNFSNCGGPGDSGSIANEPGSGSSIMGYAGLCGSNNLQLNSDAMFNSINYDQMYPYIRLTIPGVGTTTNTLNSPPVVEAGLNYTIPARTPYQLTAVGSDADGDSLTYSWEGRDTGGSLPVNNTSGFSGPIVRPWLPANSATRTIPRLQNLVINTTTTGEVLTTVGRQINFRVVARDGRGGVNFDSMTVTTIDTGSSFAITSPNTNGLTFNGGSNLDISWNVSGTNSGQINAANVKITLSLDGGFTYPVTLSEITANDGSETVQLPFNVGSNTSRIKVEAVGNIFFDINNFNFILVNIPSAPAPGQPSLSAISDSGVSNSDRITNFDNSSSLKAMEFVVPNTTLGATVKVYADGIEIGSAVASSTTTTIVTNGTVPLANGVRNITARQQSGVDPQSPDSPLLAVTIDTVAPTVVGLPAFGYATAPHSLNFTFNEDVGPTIQAGDFTVTQLPSTPITVNAAYNSGTNTASLSFPTFTNGVLANGRYEAVLSAAGVTDIAGNAMLANVNSQFLFLLGDANNDGQVNLADFNILAANFGQSPRDFTHGDFNYDGQVNLADFNILAAQFGTSVAPDGSLGRTPGALVPPLPGSVGGRLAAPKFGTTVIGGNTNGSNDDRIELLV